MTSDYPEIVNTIIRHREGQGFSYPPEFLDRAVLAAEVAHATGGVPAAVQALEDIFTEVELPQREAAYASPG